MPESAGSVNVAAAYGEKMFANGIMLLSKALMARESTFSAPPASSATLP